MAGDDSGGPCPACSGNEQSVEIAQHRRRRAPDEVLAFGALPRHGNEATLDAIQLKETTLEKAIMDGSLKIEGRREAFAEFMGLLDTFPFWFNIVTP